MVGPPARRENQLNRFERELSAAVAAFGAAVRHPLREQVGGAEDQIQAPVARLVRAVGRSLGLLVVTHAEVMLSDLSVKPDFAVHVAGSLVGYVESSAQARAQIPLDGPLSLMMAGSGRK